MINIVEKEDCCGCESCVQICPKQCISFVQDKEGFFYPTVDIAECVDCGLCETRCPIINSSNTKEPLRIYAAKNLDEGMLKESSSGGIFTLLAEYIIERGGVVFGARFNNDWGVVHSYTDSINGLSDFRGSKYVQSRIMSSYLKVEEFLNSGREVLFSGTPCQVKGLRSFLSRDYDNLLLVDFICHGVPSPMVWYKYLDEVILNKDKSIIDKISFRDKTSGWRKYSLCIHGSINKQSFCHTECFKNNIYMKGFLNNLYLRPSCYSCSVKSFKSGSDITMADFWGVKNILPDYDDDKGLSLTVINTNRGGDIFGTIKKYSVVVTSSTLDYNRSYSNSAPINNNREKFFKALNNDKMQLSSLIVKHTTKMCFIKRLMRRMRKIILRLFMIKKYS